MVLIRYCYLKKVMHRKEKLPTLHRVERLRLLLCSRVFKDQWFSRNTLVSWITLQSGDLSGPFSQCTYIPFTCPPLNSATCYLLEHVSNIKSAQCTCFDSQLKKINALICPRLTKPQNLFYILKTISFILIVRIILTTYFYTVVPLRYCVLFPVGLSSLPRHLQQFL